MPAWDEFAIIRNFFTPTQYSAEVRLGVGDDCARLSLNPDEDLLITTDTMVEGVHFFPNTAPESLAQRILAINLSDIAACGGRPRWLVWAFNLPQAEEAWLQRFQAAYQQVAVQYGLQLIGGNLTRSTELSITVTLFGSCSPTINMRRSAAQVGDGIYLTGDLGLPAYALQLLQNNLVAASAELQGQALEKYYHPQARVAEGQVIARFAHAAIDISDGLCADLTHLAEASNCGIELDYADLPIAELLRGVKDPALSSWVLNGGDEYELCWTMAPEHEAQLRASWPTSTPWQRIGTIVAQAGLRVRQAGEVISNIQTGWRHF